ncbi:MAG TPA: hypothetical protein VI384_04430 [Candidatus Dormibacteraeota bacterium]
MMLLFPLAVVAVFAFAMVVGDVMPILLRRRRAVRLFAREEDRRDPYYLLAAMREVDAMLPGTPPIAPPPIDHAAYESARRAMIVYVQRRDWRYSTSLNAWVDAQSEIRLTQQEAEAMGVTRLEAT